MTEQKTDAPEKGSKLVRKDIWIYTVSVRLTGERRHKMKDKDCIFCKIANGDIPSQTVYEDEDFRVILDLNPASEGHALILPKEHYKDLTELPDELSAKALKLAGKIGQAMKKGLGCSGFNVVQNNGISAGQTVFHFHIHIIPRYDNAPLIVTWKPGTSTPEGLKQTADRIKAGL